MDPNVLLILFFILWLFYEPKYQHIFLKLQIYSNHRKWDKGILLLDGANTTFRWISFESKALITSDEYPSWISFKSECSNNFGPIPSPNFFQIKVHTRVLSHQSGTPFHSKNHHIALASNLQASSDPLKLISLKQNGSIVNITSTLPT